MPAVTVPIAVIPLWILAIANAVAAVVFLTYGRGYWARVARVFARATLAGTAFWMVSALLLGAAGPGEAARWARLYVPLAFLAELGLVEAELHLMDITLPRGFFLLWILGFAGLGAFLDPRSAGPFVLQRVPDGFWIGHALQPAWLSGLRALVYGGGLLAAGGILAWGFARRRQPRLRLYLMAALGTVPLLFNDAVWVQTHVTWYPTIWIAGLWILGLMWWELRTEVHRTYACLDTDAMTQASSRGFGELYGARCLSSEPVGAVYGDIDNFKEINDRLGHAAGDTVLREVVARIRSVCRSRDQVVRLGGDELLIILPGAHEGDGSAVLARISQTVGQPPIALAGSSSPSTATATISLGWAWGAQGSEFDHLVQRADGAMYVEKNRRRGEHSRPSALPGSDPVGCGPRADVPAPEATAP